VGAFSQTPDDAKALDGAVDHTAIAAKICRDLFEIR
jgi:hypothetical protein